MKFKTTIILFAIFLALLAFVFLFESKKKERKGKEENLVDLSSDDVERILFKKEDETIGFKKDEKGEWFITEPVEAKADNYEVNRIAEDFSRLRMERVVEAEPEGLKTYEIPKKEISLWYKGKDQPVKILIGMENPLDSTFFAKREDEKRVVLIPSYLKSLLEKKTFDFRQKDIFKFETEEVKNIQLKAKDIQWTAKKTEEGWFFENPVKALAEKSKVESILSSLSSLRAKEFVSEAKKDEEIKKFALENPEYRIHLSIPKSNQELIFSLQKKEDKVFATTSLSSKIIAAEEQILTDLEKKLEDLREKSVAEFYSWEAEKLSLKKGDLSLAVSKGKEDKWFFEPELKEEADSSKIETFIRKIENLEAKEFVDEPKNLADYGLDVPQAEVKISVKEDKDRIKEINVFVGKEDKEKKQVAVKNARLDYLFIVDSGFLEEFPKEGKDWKKTEEEQKVEKKEEKNLLP